MRNHKEKTRKLVKLLRCHPVIVADIFEYGASGMLVPEIVRNINEFWADDFDKKSVQITDHYVWSLFHRRAPFHDAALYSQVPQENQEKVSARLYSTESVTFSLKDDIQDFDHEQVPVTDSIQKLEKRVVITNVLHARVQYERCLQDARLAGVDVDALNEWIDIAIEQELLS